MLVLSRRLNEAIIIAGRVRVRVLTITASRVELGVEAPLQISVDREEVYHRKRIQRPLRGPRRQERRPAKVRG